MLNGAISCRDVKIQIPMMGGTLTLDTVPLTVQDSKIAFDDFDIYGVQNSLKLNGTVDASNLTDTRLDLSLQGNNFMLIDNDSAPAARFTARCL